MVFDPATDQVTLATDMVRARAGHLAVLLPSGRVFINAGGTGNSADNGTTELYTNGIASEPLVLSAGPPQYRLYLPLVLK